MLKFTGFLFISLFLSNLVFADELEVKMKKYPITKTFSLGKRGLILYGEDPNKNSNQKEIVLIKDNKVVWYSQFMPSAFNVIPIYSNESNYMYFIDEGYVKGGTLNYIFVDNSGTSRKGKLNLSMELRKAGAPNPSKLDLIKMYSTKRYMVMLFSEKVGTEILYYSICIAHSSQKIYPKKFVGTAFEEKENLKSGIDYLGSNEDDLLFAQRVKDSQFEGYYITFYNPQTAAEDIRKFSFPFTKMAKHQKIFTKGVYDKHQKPISINTLVKSINDQSTISFIQNNIIFSGVEWIDGPKSIMVKKMDLNAKTLFNVKHSLKEYERENPTFLKKIKEGNFGFQLAFYRGFYMGALSSKSTLLFYLNANSGEKNFSDIGAFSLDDFNKNIYYLFEDLQNKEYPWYQICARDLYSSNSSVFNKMKVTLIRHKL